MPAKLKAFDPVTDDGQGVILVDAYGVQVRLVALHGFDVSADGRWLFVSSKSGNKISRINLINNDVLRLDLEPAPYHLDFVEQVNKLYVSSRKQPKIWVIDPVTMKVDHEIDIGKGVAHQMVILNK